MNYNCSIFCDLRNLQEQVKKVFCYLKLFWPFTFWINCSSDLKFFENSLLSASNFKSFSQSLEQFYLTVGQNNFGNKIPFLCMFVTLRTRLHTLQNYIRHQKPYKYMCIPWTLFDKSANHSNPIVIIYFLMESLYQKLYLLFLHRRRLWLWTYLYHMFCDEKSTTRPAQMKTNHQTFGT